MEQPSHCGHHEPARVAEGQTFRGAPPGYCISCILDAETDNAARRARAPLRRIIVELLNRLHASHGEALSEDCKDCEPLRHAVTRAYGSGDWWPYGR